MTHPAVEERISYIGSWIASYDASHKPIPYVNEDDFNRVHTRIETEYGDEQVVLSRLEADAVRNPEDPMAHYRYGLILARVGKRQDAIEQIRLALTKKAFDPYILRDLGWIYYLDGQLPQALKTLNSACGMMPKDPECKYYQGRVRLDMGNLSEAADDFLQLTRQYPQFDEAFYYLGQSLGQQQKLGEAHYYLGVFYLKRRDPKNATVQFKQALKHLEDPDKRKEAEKWLAQMGGAKKAKQSD
jgi:predicted Zn-dependent protease